MSYNNNADRFQNRTIISITGIFITLNVSDDPPPPPHDIENSLPGGDVLAGHLSDQLESERLLAGSTQLIEDCQGHNVPSLLLFWVTGGLVEQHPGVQQVHAGLDGAVAGSGQWTPMIHTQTRSSG